MQRYGLFLPYDGQWMKWFWTIYELHETYVLFMICAGNVGDLE